MTDHADCDHSRAYSSLSAGDRVSSHVDDDRSMDCDRSLGGSTTCMACHPNTTLNRDGHCATHISARLARPPRQRRRRLVARRPCTGIPIKYWNFSEVEARSVLSRFVPPTLSRQDPPNTAEIFKLVQRSHGCSGREDHPRAGRVRALPLK